MSQSHSLELSNTGRAVVLLNRESGDLYESHHQQAGISERRYDNPRIAIY